MPTFITFRDCDLFYKWPWVRVGWAAANKVGYLTRAGIVIYPWRWGLKRKGITAIERHHKVFAISELPPLREDDNIETFFTQNRANPYLFSVGVHALNGRLEYFNNPVKLPILDRIPSEEFERRWGRFTALLRPGDAIYTLDTQSAVSRLIAYLDQGTWSHSATYIGNGQIIEAIPPCIVERSIDVYRSPRYRLGLYRFIATPEQTELQLAFARSQIGKPYAYRKVLRLAMRKLLLRPPPAGRQVTPNEFIYTRDIPLIFVV
jgi:YD repeat-containing protein